MGVDLVLFQEEKGGDPNVVRESQRRRFAPVELVDEIIALTNDAREKRHAAEMQRADQKKMSKDMAGPNMELRKLQKVAEGERTDEQKAAIAALEKQVGELKQAASDAAAAVKAAFDAVDQIEAERDAKLDKIGNIVHESVPVSDTEDKNIVEREVGERTSAEAKPLHHHEVLHRLYLADLDRGNSVSGHRGYFLRGAGVRLNQALITYALDFLTQRGFTELQTPFFMRKDVMGKTCQLGSDDDLYHLSNDDSYLIATSEQPVSAFHQQEWFAEKDIVGKPIKYAGYSTCFRREAGSSGRDVTGIFRVHQFEKVEQFVICAPDESWEMLEEMTKTAEEFYQSLGLAYRVVTIVSKELNSAAAKKYDVEAWFPARQDYRELVSASNCTDYQSRALGVKFGTRTKEDKSEKFVHMLNGTMCATERTMCCILENYQDENGVVIPEVLRPYMGGKERLDWVRELPAAPAANKSGKKSKAERKVANPNAAEQGGKGKQ